MSSDRHRPRADDGLSAPLVRKQIVEVTVEKDAAPPVVSGEGNSSSIPWLTVLGFVFLSFNSGMALYRSQGDVAAVSFVVFLYVDLVLLFYCLRRYERAAAGSAQREWLKAAVWVLTAALTVVFSYKVAAIMPLPVAVLVWAMAFVTVAGGFYALFLHSEK